MSWKSSPKQRSAGRARSVRTGTSGALKRAEPPLRHSVLVLVALPAWLAVAVFANTLQNEPAYDDFYRLKDLAGELRPLSHVWLQPRGLTYATQVLDQRLWGSWIPGFRLTNVLLHALASCLATYGAFILSRSRRLAILCGALFAVHPVHVEAVASFANRKDVLAMIFVCLALIFWRRSGRPVAGYLPAALCYVLGMLAKEVAAVGLAPLLLLGDVVLGTGSTAPRRERLTRLASRFVPLLLIGVAATVAVAGRLSRHFTTEVIQTVSQSYPQVLANTAAAIPENFRLLFFPVKLSVDYPAWPEMTLLDPKALCGIVLVLSWLVVSWVVVRRAPLASFAMLWTVLTYLPCSNVVPLTTFFVAERYLYVPSFGVCLLLAWIVDRGLASTSGPKHGPARAVVVSLAILLVVAAGWRSTGRNRDWRTQHSLWTSALDAGYETPRIHNSVGASYFTRREFGRAIRHFKKSLALRPGSNPAHLNLVMALVETLRFEEAAEECEEILAQLPANAQCLDAMGRVESLRGNTWQSIIYYEKVLATTDAASPYHLADLEQLAFLRATAPEAELRDARQAVELGERARRLTRSSDPFALMILAFAYREAGDHEKAVEWGRKGHVLARIHRDDALAANIAALLESIGERPLKVP